MRQTDQRGPENTEAPAGWVHEALGSGHGAPFRRTSPSPTPTPEADPPSCLRGRLLGASPPAITKRLPTITNQQVRRPRAARARCAHLGPRGDPTGPSRRSQSCSASRPLHVAVPCLALSPHCTVLPAPWASANISVGRPCPVLTLKDILAVTPCSSPSLHLGQRAPGTRTCGCLFYI